MDKLDLEENSLDKNLVRELGNLYSFLSNCCFLDYLNDNFEHYWFFNSYRGNKAKDFMKKIKEEVIPQIKKYCDLVMDMIILLRDSEGLMSREEIEKIESLSKNAC